MGQPCNCGHHEGHHVPLEEYKGAHVCLYIEDGQAKVCFCTEYQRMNRRQYGERKTTTSVSRLNGLVHSLREEL